MVENIALFLVNANLGCYLLVTGKVLSLVQIFFNMESIPRKEMSSSKKLFRVSSEVRSVLQRKHDKWSPVRAYDRLKKDLHVFHAMCKVFLRFFAKFGTGHNEGAACDGKTVKMFSDLIRRCLDDDDFV